MLAIVHTVLSVLLAVLLLATGGGKVVGAASSHAIRDSLHVPPGRWRAIGAFEVAVVVALALGIWLQTWAVVGAAGVVVLMVGAVVTRVRAGGVQRRTGVPADLVVLLLGAAALTLAVTVPS
ncbi:DoxX family protein [Aquipuribacter sp. MA13-6]|uniref:DoxX family protein n=1 Tax=unclassified Aquipuribacter TaxID=2635084 RepID=UPI003EEE8630